MNPQRPPLDRKTLILALVGMNALWSGVNVFVRIAIAEGMSPTAIVLVRWSLLDAVLFAALATKPFRRLTGAIWPSRRGALGAAVLGAALFAPAHLLYFHALARITSVEGVVLGTTAPLWTALLGFVLLRERVTGRRSAAIALGITGAWVVALGPSASGLGQGSTEGNGLYLLGVLAESVAFVAATGIVRRSSGVTVYAFLVGGSVLTFALAAWLLPGTFSLTFALTLPVVAALAYLVFLAGLVAWGGAFALVERTPVSLMAVSVLLQPPLTALLGWAFLGERVTPALGVGFALIVGALALAVSEERSGAVGGAAAGHEVPGDERDHHDHRGDGDGSGRVPVVRREEFPPKVPEQRERNDEGEDPARARLHAPEGDRPQHHEARGDSGK